MIKGKDAPLEATLSCARRILKEAGFEIVERDVENPLGSVFCVFIYDKNITDFFSNGKGYSQKAALASAYAEFIERAFSGFFFQDSYLGGAKNLYSSDEIWVSKKDAATFFSGKEHAFYRDIDGFSWENLIDFSSSKDEILAQPYVRFSDFIDELDSCSEFGERLRLDSSRAKKTTTIFFPRALLHNLYSSNGIAAGNTLKEALVQAISEVIERAVHFRVIREGLCLPEIPQSVVDSYPKVGEVVRILKEFGYKISLRDASLGGRFPVVAAILVNTKDAGAMMIFGAHPNFEIALSRTLSELLQGRVLSDFKNLDVMSLDLEACAELSNLESHFINSTGKIPWRCALKNPDFKFVRWGVDGSRDDELKSLAKCLQRENIELFWREEMSFNDNGSFSVVRVIAPKFSEIYPLEDLVCANMNATKCYREAILGWDRLERDTLLSLFDEILQLDENRPLDEFLGVSCEGYFKNALFGEFQLLLALFLGEREYALEGARWAMDTLKRDDARWLDYALLERLLVDKNLNVDEIFPSENIARVRSWIGGVREGLLPNMSKAKCAQRVLKWVKSREN